MCGILGTFRLPELDVESGLDLIAHRGPDGRGVAYPDDAVHGHVRLALVDLTAASAQPIRAGNGVLSFVGEIWNWRALRQRLADEGRWMGGLPESDTGVLAGALFHWGIEATLPRLEGMFAFAWSHRGGHWLVRDRFGKVPLYVHRSPAGGWAWCSELKGLGRDRPAVAMPPGGLLSLVSGHCGPWYELPAPEDVAPASPDQVLADLNEGVRLRLAADAPVCCLISGGLDSSLILALALAHHPQVTAYTAVLDPGSPDLDAARRLCADLGVRLVEVPVEPPTPATLAEAVRSIELASKAQVEIAAMCIPLARAVAADGFKACLSGEGADELFGGYGNMCIQASGSGDEAWRGIRVYQLAKMARGNFVRCNKAFMAAGVECRLPFLHRPLVEKVLGADKATCPPGKKLLKAAAAPVLPKWVINRVKETFQGGSGMSNAANRAVASPARFYNAERLAAFGASAG